MMYMYMDKGSEAGILFQQNHTWCVWSRGVRLTFYSRESYIMYMGKGSEAGILFNRIEHNVYGQGY